MLDEVANVEAVEADLNRFIERRARHNDEANAAEMMWKASARKHNDRLRTERLHDRLAWHQAMLEAHTKNYEEILRRHRVGLRLCEEALGIAGDEGAA